MNRRSFLSSLGAVGAGMLLPASASRAARVRGGAAPPAIGVQLYTLRGAMAADLEGTLTRLASLGCREVEFAGYFGRTPAQIRAALAAAGLRAPSTHLPLEALEGERLERSLAESAEMGHEWVVVPWLAVAQRRTLDDWKRMAARFNAIGAAARRAGLSFAYHNHDFEITPLEGQMPLEVLIANSDPALVKIQLDVYWTVKGGADPLAFFARHPGRVTMLHLKDSGGPPDHRMTEVGAGAIDWTTILERGMAQGVRHAFIEHDNPADAWGSVEASVRYMKSLTA